MKAMKMKAMKMAMKKKAMKMHTFEEKYCTTKKMHLHYASLKKDQRFPRLSSGHTF